MSAGNTSSYKDRMKRLIPFVPPAGVIFDMDGVICDTRIYHLRAFQELCQRHGRDLSEEEFQHLFGMENRKLIPRIFQQDLPAPAVRELADWKEARYREMIADAIELMPGVAELIHWLNVSRRPIAVASNAPRANVEQILESTGLAGRFDVVLAYEDVTRSKPDPEVFLTAASRLGIPPAQTWVIEDSLHGIEAGLAAGMTVLAVATTHLAGELAPAHAVFADVADIYKQLLRQAKDESC